MSNIKHINIDDIDMSGPPRHATLPEALVERIKRFKEILKEVETMPLEQTLYNFRCDKNPQNEVAIWEEIAENYEQQTLNQPELTLEAKKDIYRKIFTRISEEHPIRVVKKERSLKFKVLTDEGLTDWKLEMNFVGTTDEEKIASSLLTHLMTGNLIIGIDFQDVEKLLGKKTNKLLVYEFNLPFEPEKFAEKIKGIEFIVYGVYGEFDLLDMHLFESIQKTMWDNSKNSVGAPISPESIGAVTSEKAKNIKIVALYN